MCLGDLHDDSSLYETPFIGQTAALPLSTQSTSTNPHPEGSRTFLSSISPVSGYFEKQGGMTQKAIIPLQSETHSESSSSKQTTGIVPLKNKLTVP